MNRGDPLHPGDILVLREWAARMLSVESTGLDPHDDPFPLVWFKDDLRPGISTGIVEKIGYSCVVVLPPEPDQVDPGAGFYECLVLWGGTLLSVDGSSDMFRYFDLLPRNRRGRRG